jgi:K+-transporting ATPase KdpF subunit
MLDALYVTIAVAFFAVSWAYVRGCKREGQMDYAIAGVISAALAVYLIYALLRPEKF